MLHTLVINSQTKEVIEQYASLSVAKSAIKDLVDDTLNI